MPPKKCNRLLKMALPILLLLALVITHFAYQPGLQGTFVFDDNPNIVRNVDLAIHDAHIDTLKRAAFSGHSGPFQRPISMLSFALNFYATGANPYYFKLTNLFIHLSNGLGIFVLGFVLLGVYRKRFQPELSDWHIRAASLAVTAAWLLHPFNLTSVLYVVQRMTSLSAFFCIWGLVLFVWGRYRLLEGRSGIIPILVSLCIFVPLATLCKETGALMPAFMLVIEITLFNFQAAKASARRFLTGFFVLTVAIPALIVLGFLVSHPAWLPSTYLGRSFTLIERVLTETRVIWFYLREIVLPNIKEMGLFHDDIINSQGILTPVTTLVAILGLAALLLSAWIARKVAPLVSFGILFFLAGHALESTVFPLEIAHEHRNYLPMFGILLPLFFYLLYPLKYTKNLRLRQVVALLLIGLFAFDTWSRSIIWSNPFDWARSEVENHPNSARDNGEMGNSYAAITTQDSGITEAYYRQAVHYYEQSAVVDPNYTNGLFALIIVSSAKGKSIDSHWIDELKHRLQFSPAESDMGNKLNQLFSCQYEQTCKLAKQDLVGLINAALKNPTVTGTTRALVLASYSYYLINLVHDYPAALDNMYKTIELAPQVLAYRLTLVEFLIALQRTEEAKRELAIMKNMDRTGEYAQQIAEEEKRFAKTGNDTLH